ncbi:hypothetical protein ACTMU2_35760 (plasmid) [Cupriavidus basilensis]
MEWSYDDEKQRADAASRRRGPNDCGIERRAPQRAEVDDQVTLEVLESGTGHLEALIREARPRIRPSRIALALALRNGRRWQSKVGAQQVRMKRNKKIAQYMVGAATQDHSKGSRLIQAVFLTEFALNRDSR